MEWKEVSEKIGKIAPMQGTLLSGATGGISAVVGGIISSALGVENSPSAVSQAISVNPDAAVKLAQIEADQKVKLQELSVSAANNIIAADTQRILAINATMQSETKSDHWPSYAWRPFNGFIVGIMAFGCYFILPLCKVPVPVIPETVWLMFGAILGVASWFRGKMQADTAIPTDNRG